jgi:hypothetical protein
MNVALDIIQRSEETHECLMYNDWWHGSSADSKLSCIRIVSPTGNERVMYYNATCGVNGEANGVTETETRLLIELIHYTNNETKTNGRGGVPCIVPLRIEQMLVIDRLASLQRL